MSLVEHEARGRAERQGGEREEGRNWAADKPYGEIVANHPSFLL